MNITEIAAWWGACVATLLLLWDVFKWRYTGAELAVDVMPYMPFFDDNGEFVSDKNTIGITVSNIGTTSTTLTSVVACSYETRWHELIRKETYIAGWPSWFDLPVVVRPGEQWSCYLDQSEDLVEDSHKYQLYFGVKHSRSKKPAIGKLNGNIYPNKTLNNQTKHGRWGH